MQQRQPLLLPVSIVVDAESLQRMTDGHGCVRHVFVLVWLALVSVSFAFVYSSAPNFAMERACTAVLSLALSLFVFSRFWAAHDWLPIFAFFALRGASLSILLTLLLEVYAQFFSVSFSPTSVGGVWGLLSSMLLVGVKEETAKLFSVLIGSSLSPVALESVGGCCSSFHPSPVRLALCGVAVGFGFMLLENVEYFIVVDLSPDEGPVSRVLTGLLRSLFNLHPLLTGLVAARLAQVVFARPVHLRHSHVLDWLQALWPSALVHGLYDFLASLDLSALIASNGDWAVLAFELGLVVGTWLFTHFLFQRTLTQISHVSGETASSSAFN